jgi:integrase
VLSSILSSARKWGYKVPTVALSDLSLPRKTKARPRVYSASEMARIVSYADEPLGTICFVLGSTGMRIGEVLALRIEDLDFQRNLIHVRHSVFAGALGTPKSEASMATLPMPLDHHRRRTTTTQRPKNHFLGLYAHVVPQSQRDAIEGLANAISSGQLLTQQEIAESAQRKSFVS